MTAVWISTAQQMIVLFSPQPLLRLSQPSVQLKSCPRLRNPAWPAAWSAGERSWSSQAPTSSQSPRSSSWRKALVSVMSTQQLGLETPLEKQLVPITHVVKLCFMVVWQIVSERPPLVKTNSCVVCWTNIFFSGKKTKNWASANLHVWNYMWKMSQKSGEDFIGFPPTVQFKGKWYFPALWQRNMIKEVQVSFMWVADQT